MIDTLRNRSHTAIPSSLWRHVHELATLQWQLLKVDTRSAADAIRLPGALLALSAATFVAAEVVLMFGIATYAAEWTLRPAIALIVVGVVAAGLAIVVALLAYRWLSRALRPLERSKMEMALNLQMLVNALSSHNTEHDLPTRK